MEPCERPGGVVQLLRNGIQCETGDTICLLPVLRGENGEIGMIGKILAMCFIGFVVFAAGVIVGMAVEEWSQDQKEKWDESRKPRGWDKNG